MRVLDLGCGTGKTPSKLALPSEWEIIGCDINKSHLHLARKAYPQRQYLICRGENLPYRDGAFDHVVANVSLPYMRIGHALQEVHRVLKPGGSVWISYHPLRMILTEIVHGRIRRALVLWHGIRFHLTGESVAESFQTKHGLTMALRNFRDISFSRDQRRWIVTAKKAEDYLPAQSSNLRQAS